MRHQPDFTYDLHPLLQKRKSTRIFNSKSIDRDTILTIFEAAQWSASCFNEQPWRFIFAEKSHNPELYAKLLDSMMEWNQAWAKTAPLLVMTLARKEFEYNGKPNEYALHDVGMATACLTFQAVSMGLQVHPMAGFEKDKSIEIFGIPDTIEPVTMLAIGYMGEPEELEPEYLELELAERERKELKTILIERLVIKQVD